MNPTYKMAITNCANTLRISNAAKAKLNSLPARATKKRAELETHITTLTAFDMSATLAIAFAMNKPEVIQDIILKSSELESQGIPLPISCQ